MARSGVNSIRSDYSLVITFRGVAPLPSDECCYYILAIALPILIETYATQSGGTYKECFTAEICLETFFMFVVLVKCI